MARQRQGFGVVGAIACALWCATARPALADIDPPTLAGLMDLLSDQQIPEARAEIDGLRAQEGDELSSPVLGFAHARTLFLEGRYTEAVAVSQAILAQVPEGLEAPARALRDEALRSQDAVKGFDEFVSEDRRFQIRYQGKDRLIVPWLVDVLRAQDDALARIFGGRTRGPVLVELYPNPLWLAKVSPLTEKELETSGTIALCKHNRLMVTSPRGLARGYGWRDTVAHEFVHYYISRYSAESVPIWLHEGLAKYFERAWRGTTGLVLDPPEEDLLARSLKADQLVTFSQMHPSLAKLPSQESAALAYAQVHTVVDFLVRKKGPESLLALLDRLRAGDEMDPALRKTYGFALDGLWTAWKRDVTARGFKSFPGLVQTPLKFKRPGQADDPAADAAPDFASMTDKKVRDAAHLGELLRARGRHRAALMEYDKAVVAGADAHPLVQNGAAASLRALGRHEEVAARLERVRLYYPGELTTWLNLAGAAYALAEQAPQRRAEALAAYEEAFGINPFHPEVLTALVALYTQAGDTARAGRIRDALAQLGATPQHGAPSAPASAPTETR